MGPDIVILTKIDDDDGTPEFIQLVVFSSCHGLTLKEHFSWSKIKTDSTKPLKEAVFTDL